MGTSEEMGSVGLQASPVTDQFVRVVSYASDNAPVGYEAVAHLWLDGQRLPVSFNAATRESAETKARAHWEAEMVKHAASIAARAEGRRKAAESRARKAWKCPIDQPGCATNCGNYGCGN